MLMPLPDIPQAHRVWVAAAFLLGAIARDALGDPHHRLRRRATPRPSPTARPECCVTCQLTLTAREIARELYLSVNTVKTHQRHLYQKLGACSRTEAVGQARALGLLASSPHGSDRKPEDRHVLKSQAFRRTESLVPPGQPRLREKGILHGKSA